MGEDAAGEEEPPELQPAKRRATASRALVATLVERVPCPSIGLHSPRSATGSQLVGVRNARATTPGVPLISRSPGRRLESTAYHKDSAPASTHPSTALAPHSPARARACGEFGQPGRGRLRSAACQAGQAGEHRMSFLEPHVGNLGAVAGVPAKGRPAEPPQGRRPGAGRARGRRCKPFNELPEPGRRRRPREGRHLKWAKLPGSARPRLPTRRSSDSSARTDLAQVLAPDCVSVH